MTDQPPYLVQLGDAQTAVVRELFDSLPPGGWSSCTAEYLKVGSFAESRVFLADTAGASELIESPNSVIRAFKKLRELMAAQGRGAWLSASLTAASDGKCSFDYNYDARPNWTVQPSDESYVADLEKFPRPLSWFPAGIHAVPDDGVHGGAPDVLAARRGGGRAAVTGPPWAGRGLRLPEKLVTVAALPVAAPAVAEPMTVCPPNQSTHWNGQPCFPQPCVPPYAPGVPPCFMPPPRIGPNGLPVFG